mgnify:FL=1
MHIISIITFCVREYTDRQDFLKLAEPDTAASFLETAVDQNMTDLEKDMQQQYFTFICDSKQDTPNQRWNILILFHPKDTMQT